VKPPTRLVRGTGPGSSPPLDRSTTFAYRDGEVDEFVYQRFGHPTGAEAERLLGELDGGHALLFASGAGASTALLLTLLQPGATVALAEGAYYGTSVLVRELGRWGLRLEEFDQTGPPPADADLVWLEAPSNPFLTMPDLEAAAAHRAPVVVDSTAATPIHLRPLEHRADFVLHSATKFLSGHADTLLGAVVCRSEDDARRLAEVRTRTGIVAAPDPAWLLLRGLRTLDVRMERHAASASELARRLAGDPRVERVRYPGFGGLLSFDVAGDARAVERAVAVIRNATSLGGVESVLETRRRWEGDRVPENLIRLSVGLEDVDDLWADLHQALGAAAGMIPASKREERTSPTAATPAPQRPPTT
jgi:cystathionine gamma-synthase